MRKNDWDLLIAHFLGVDHCGHKHGPLHREMSRKLTEMNEVIQSLAQTIDDDTLLIVMGDHGMTISGDHGGASVDETEALLFAYSKQKAFVPTKYDNDAQSIQQIDLAPTLVTKIILKFVFLFLIFFFQEHNSWDSSAIFQPWKLESTTSS